MPSPSSTSSSTSVKPTANDTTTARPRSNTMPATSLMGNRPISARLFSPIRPRTHVIVLPITGISASRSLNPRNSGPCRATQIAAHTSSTSEPTMPALTSPKPPAPGPEGWCMFAGGGLEQQVAVGRRARFQGLDVQLRRTHPAQQAVQVGRGSQLDADQRLAGLPVVALDVLEQGDVVIRSQHRVEEPPQRAGLLREVHQEVVLEAEVHQRTFEHFAVARHVVVAARYQAHHRRTGLDVDVQ